MQHLAPGIMLFDNIFPESTAFLEKVYQEKYPWNTALVRSSNEVGVNKTKRDTDIIVFPEYIETNNTIMHDFGKSFYNSIQSPLQSYFSEYGPIIDQFLRPSLLRYGNGQFFNNHIDDNKFNHRRLSMTYYIDEDYEGGEIQFKRFGLEVKAKKHQLLIFPSNFVYNHEINPVTSGVRHVIVQWMV